MAAMHNLLASSEFWSAIVGAVVGGLIAFGVQMVALRETRRAREEDNFTRRQTLAYSLLDKMMRVHSDLQELHKALEKGFAGVAESGAEPWQSVSPLVNPGPDIFFTSDEKGMLLAQKDFALYNAVASMDYLRNSDYQVLKRYTEIVQTLTSALPTPVAFDDSWVSVELTAEDKLKFGPQMLKANSLASTLRMLAETHHKEADATLHKLADRLRESGLAEIRLTPSAGKESRAEVERRKKSGR
jgi:hypothetical protein